MRKTYIQPRTRYAEITPEQLLADSDTQDLGMDNTGTNADLTKPFLSRDKNIWDEEW